MAIYQSSTVPHFNERDAISFHTICCLMNHYCPMCVCLMIMLLIEGILLFQVSCDEVTYVVLKNHCTVSYQVMVLACTVFRTDSNAENSTRKSEV
jgi:hypothetical protein